MFAGDATVASGVYPRPATFSPAAIWEFYKSKPVIIPVWPRPKRPLYGIKVVRISGIEVPSNCASDHVRQLNADAQV